MRSEFGNSLGFALEGESHGEAVSGEIIGFPADFRIDIEELYAFMKRRQGGNSPFTTSRREEDIPVFSSGVEVMDNGDLLTNGERLVFSIPNNNKRSSDYSGFWDTPRPSHADYTARMRYGDGVDLRGGGHFSARLTAPLCVIGGICMQWIEAKGIRIGAHLARCGGVDDTPFDAVNLEESEFFAVRNADFPTLSAEAGRRMVDRLFEARALGDSVGGVVECAAIGVPAGLGDPLFCGMENVISQLIFALGGVRGIEFGDGFAASDMRGSEHNDPFITDGAVIRTETNHCGGIQAGITNGMPLIFRVAFKPTASISMAQRTVSLSKMTGETLTVGGRHDPCIAIRAIPCVEAVTAIALADSWLSRNND